MERPKLVAIIGLYIPRLDDGGSSNNRGGGCSWRYSVAFCEGMIRLSSPAGGLRLLANARPVSWYFFPVEIIPTGENLFWIPYRR